MKFFSDIMTEIILLLVSFCSTKIFPKYFRYDYQGKNRKSKISVVHEKLFETTMYDHVIFYS